MSKYYEIKYDKQAQKDILFWKKTSKIIYNRLERIIKELKEHPREGTGKPEPLKNVKDGWSRRLRGGDRVEYRIRDKEVIVTVVSARGHYGDH